MKIHRKSLSGQIRDELLSRIGNGDMLPGSRVVESAIAREFGVSSIPVREAIRELVAMGILEHGHHKGGRVREVGIPETIQALQVRSALESLAARLAGMSLQRRLGTMRTAVQQIIEAARRRDYVSFQKANTVFHREIVEAPGNDILLRMWKTLAFEVRTRAIMEYIAVADPVSIAREHEAVAEAIAEGDVDRAASLLADHSVHLVDHLRRATGHRRGSVQTAAKERGHP
jgi:DNA-binding GntR family transcriptional regulator